MENVTVSGEPVVVARVRASGAVTPAPAGTHVRCLRSASRALLKELDAADERTVLVLVETPTPHLIRSLFLRCSAIVEADTLESSLGDAVAAVAAGLCVFPAAYRDALRHPRLSAREKQVLAMVVLGMSNVEIAAKLYVVEASVKAHLTSAFGKLGVRSRDEAAAIILDPDAGYGPGILRITDAGSA